MCEWGEGAPVERFAERLAADKSHAIKAVLVCHNETATGVTSDVAGVRKALDAIGHPALLFVDGVSSIACIDFRMDEWGVDLAVAGSQKGFMMPTGLAIVAASQKALAAAKTAKCYALLLRLRRHDPHQQGRLFPLHAGDHAAARPARLHRPAAGAKGWTTSSPAITAWPRACARRWRPGASRSAPSIRAGIPTR